MFSRLSVRVPVLLTGLLVCVVPALGQVSGSNWPPSAYQTITNVPVQAEGHIVSSNGGASPPFTGVNINNRVGASSFYAAGYTGTTAIIASIEGGHVWNGHQTLNQGQITQYINGPGTVGAVNGTAAAVDRHATWVGQTIAGRTTTTGAGEWQRGVAYGSTLWSGTIATSFGTPPYSTSFGIATYNAFFQPYVTATRTGIGGVTADVVNSSWGSFAGAGENFMSSGRQSYSWGLDALAADTRKVFVISAGNSGALGADTVSAPATGYNVISVGALTGDTTNPSYNTVAGFSSRGLNKAFDPVLNQYIPNARVRVDISAPGDQMTLAFYGGTTGGNTGGTNTPGNNLYSSQLGGTSFAAPIVAAGAGLMVDAGRQLGLSNFSDARVIKTILLNSADKTAGWNNAQALNSGVIVTTQALDANVGAGRLNLTTALPYYNSASSTRDVAGLIAGDQGIVNNRGYDLGRVNEGAFNSYTLGSFTEDGADLTVTLNWFANRGVDSFANPTSLSEQSLANLQLEVWLLTSGSFTTLYARSSSTYNNTEHLYLTDMPAGEYGIRVVHAGDIWDFVGSTNETYAVAWEFAPVPEPGSILIVAVIALGGAQGIRRWRRRPVEPVV